MYPLLPYFQQLQQSGYTLSMEEYRLLIEALGNSRTAPKNVEQLMELCKHLWYKPGQNRKVFEDLFWEFLKKEKKTAFEFLEKEEAEWKARLESQQKLDQPRIVDESGSGDLGGSQAGQSSPQGRQSGKGIEEDVEGEENIEGNEATVRPGESRLPEQTQEFIFLNIHPQAGAAGSISLDAVQNDILFERNFSFEGAYAPLSRRELQNVWRYLPTRQVDKRDSDRLDVKATVKEIARLGEQFFVHPKFEQELKREAGLLILVDHLGSMIAFEDFSREVEATAREWFKHHYQSEGIEQYFFQNVPEKYLYLNTSHTRFHRIEHLRSKYALSPRPTLIISDAGAAKGNFNEARIEATGEALRLLGTFASPIAWLNPLPAKRWNDTSAQVINYLLGGTMCEASPDGFMQAINILRGKVMGM